MEETLGVKLDICFWRYVVLSALIVWAFWEIGKTQQSVRWLRGDFDMYRRSEAIAGAFEAGKATARETPCSPTVT